MTAADYRTRLGELVAERLDAVDAGLDHEPLYMSELEEDIAHTRVAFVSLAVTEIATLRAELNGPLLG